MPCLGQSEISDLSLLKKILDRPGDVLHRHIWIDAMLVEEIDIVGSKAPQAAIDGARI